MVVISRVPASWQEQVPLATHTTFQVGGPAEYFLEVRNIEELITATAHARDRHLPVTILGGGSNVLIADSGIPGLVIRMAMDEVQIKEAGDLVTFECDAGVDFDTLIAQTVASGWWGLENLSAIPGSVGATPIQNVGAYGVEVSDLISSVQVYDHTAREIINLTTNQCQFSYRHSIFKTEQARDWVVTSVTFILSKKPRPQLSYPDLAPLRTQTIDHPQRISDHVRAVRSQKFPDWHTIGTAGSFFKNPIIPSTHYQKLQQQYPELPGYPIAEGMVKVPLGWILDRVCGLRGYQDGLVGTYKGQALVLIQTGSATAADIHEFAEHIKAKVRTTTGIAIEYEVTALPAT